MTKDLVTDAWPHAAALRDLRKRSGNLSVERAAGKIGASRAAWNAWEAGERRPSYEYLAAIVEAFQCPPDLIGYVAPQGWELVPSEWIQQRMEQQAAQLDAMHNILKRLARKANA